MTIEAKLDQTNELLSKILSVLASGANVAAFANEATGDTAQPGDTTAAGEAPKNKGGRPRKNPVDGAGTTATTTPKTGTSAFDPLPGDPPGTRYWVNAAKKTAYAQKPGDPDPADTTGFKIESTAGYVAARDEQAKNAKTAGAQSTSGAADPAKGTPDASTVSSGVSDKQLTELLINLHSDPREGLGKVALKGVFEKFIPGFSGKMATSALTALKKNSEIAAYVNSLLNPNAADEDEFDMDGEGDDGDDFSVD